MRGRYKGNQSHVGNVVGSVIECEEKLLKNDRIGGSEGRNRGAILHKMKNFLQVRFPVAQNG